MILVTGATGINGSALIGRLSALGVPVRALVRDPSRAGALAALPKVQLTVGDLGKPETLVEPLKGVDRAMLISSSAPEMLHVQNSFIDAAKRAGVRHVVKLSGIMPALDSPFRYARMHGEVERHLEQSGLAFTHLRSGEFMTAYFRQVPAIVARGVIALPMQQARIACIDVDDVAEVGAKVLTQSGHEGKTYPLTGPEALTMDDVAHKLSAVTGKTVRYVDVAPEDARQAQLAAGLPPYTVDALAELFAERRKGKESRVHPEIEALLGRKATSFEAFATRCAAIFRGERPAPKV